MKGEEAGGERSLVMVMGAAYLLFAMMVILMKMLVMVTDGAVIISLCYDGYLYLCYRCSMLIPRFLW